ncbi:hypothetical protein A6A04_10180 [Paramagnetospirillum marisnigri]|uniref:Uncharacterized protein n=1 Tax=Paramagnetospirillum marisnigri TaxID=1285242 RepID=A0A178M475_9PROT|nr:hypothetical protein A6A04_10180 [Paramagnetospirillum marisnigri]
MGMLQLRPAEDADFVRGTVFVRLGGDAYKLIEPVRSSRDEFGYTRWRCYWLPHPDATTRQTPVTVNADELAGLRVWTGKLVLPR